MTNFHEDYARGMDVLLAASPSFATIIRKLGVPSANENIPTAQVSLDINDRKILFEINPDYISSMADDSVAAVIAHEAYHVLLDHFDDLANRKDFPVQDAIVQALECIINDSLPGNVGVSTGPETFHGMEQFNQDFSYFSSQEGYDFIMSQRDAQDSSDEDSEGEPDSSDSPADAGEGSGGAGRSSGGAGSSGSGEKNDEASDDKDSESASGDSDDSDEDASGDGAASGDSSEDSNNESEGASACGGITVVGDDVTSKDIKDLISKAINEAISQVGVDDVPADVVEAIEALSEDDEMSINGIGWSIGAPRNAFSNLKQLGDANLKWVDLLAKINPKVKNSGKAKVKDSWHAPRARMSHMYPDILLPNTKRKEEPRGKGDSVPTFILALDMSGSIPTHLLKDLANLATSIPEKLIKAFPITWSDSYRVFDPERPNQIVSRGGTNLNSIWRYAETIAAKTGKDPYVLVITDGQFGIPGNMTEKVLREKWYWMGIQPRDMSKLKQHGTKVPHDRIFNLADYL